MPISNNEVFQNTKLSQGNTQRVYKQFNQGLGQHSSIQESKGCGRISQLVSWKVDGLYGSNGGLPGG